MIQVSEFDQSSLADVDRTFSFIFCRLECDDIQLQSNRKRSSRQCQQLRTELILWISAKCVGKKTHVQACSDIFKQSVFLLPGRLLFALCAAIESDRSWCIASPYCHDCLKGRTWRNWDKHSWTGGWYSDSVISRAFLARIWSCYLEDATGKHWWWPHKEKHPKDRRCLASLDLSNVLNYFEMRSLIFSFEFSGWLWSFAKAPKTAQPRPQVRCTGPRLSTMRVWEIFRGMPPTQFHKLSFKSAVPLAKMTS